MSLKATEGDNKLLFSIALHFLSPIVKISFTLHFATSPEGGSENRDISPASTEEFTPEGGSDCRRFYIVCNFDGKERTCFLYLLPVYDYPLVAFERKFKFAVKPFYLVSVNP